jgi:hypothetical protein
MGVDMRTDSSNEQRKEMLIVNSRYMTRSVMVKFSICKFTDFSQIPLFPYNEFIFILIILRKELNLSQFVN